MSATLEIVPSVLDRIRRTLVGLKMPRALEVLDQTMRQLERGEASALEVIDTLFAEELTLRENRRVKMALLCSSRRLPRRSLREQAAPLAYIGGSLGTLIGADLLNLGNIRGLGAPVASIGGAGTFDGIFLIGIVAVLIASLSQSWSRS